MSDCRFVILVLIALVSFGASAPKPVTGLRVMSSTANRPSAVSDLIVTKVTDQEAVLEWTVPFSTLALVTNDVRISTTVFNEETWDSAFALPGISSPVSGHRQRLVLSVEPKTTYFVSMRMVDIGGRRSLVSPLVSFTTLEKIIVPPPDDPPVDPPPDDDPPVDPPPEDPPDNNGDNEVPEVTEFSGVLKASLTNEVSLVVTATDNVAVTGYLLTEGFSTPHRTNVTWRTNPPTNYVFSSGGLKTLVLFVKDAAGNVGGGVTVGFSIDLTIPESPAWIRSQAFSDGSIFLEWDAAVDDVGVVEYIVTRDGEELKERPRALGYRDRPPLRDSEYTYSVQAVDRFGKRSEPIGPVTIWTAAFPNKDTQAPWINSFLIPSAVSSLTVPISRLSGYDDVGVTGYLVQESAIKPSVADSRWKSIPQTSYTSSTSGTKKLYAYVKDAAGNISSASMLSTILDPTAPSVPFEVKAGWIANYTNTVSITWKPAMDNESVLFYEIFRNTTNGAPFFSTTTLAIEAGLTQTTHTYYVRAVDRAGNRSPFGIPAIVR